MPACLPDKQNNNDNKDEKIKRRNNKQKILSCLRSCQGTVVPGNRQTSRIWQSDQLLILEQHQDQKQLQGATTATSRKFGYLIN